MQMAASVSGRGLLGLGQTTRLAALLPVALSVQRLYFIICRST
jgi:hypothetical protein